MMRMKILWTAKKSLAFSAAATGATGGEGGGERGQIRTGLPRLTHLQSGLLRLLRRRLRNSNKKVQR